MKKLTTKTFPFALALLIIVSSCKKDRVDAPVLQDAQLQVSLNENYMPATKVDSALAIWEVAGKTQTITLHLTSTLR